VYYRPLWQKSCAMEINYEDIDQLFHKLISHSLPIDFEAYDPCNVVDEDPPALLDEVDEYDPEVVTGMPVMEDDCVLDDPELVTGMPVVEDDMPAVTYDMPELVDGCDVGKTGREEALDLLAQIAYTPRATDAFERVHRDKFHREINHRSPSWRNQRSHRPQHRSPRQSRPQRRERARPHVRLSSRPRPRRPRN